MGTICTIYFDTDINFIIKIKYNCLVCLKVFVGPCYTLINGTDARMVQIRR